MPRLNLNLLPPELQAKKKQKRQAAVLIRFSVIFIIIVIAAAAVTLSIRLSQNLLLGNISKDLETARNKINGPEYKTKEVLAVTLKNRLESIDAVNSQKTFPETAYSALNSLIPPGVELQSIDISDKGKVMLVTEAPDLSSLATLFNNLVDTNRSNGNVISINLDSLSRTGAGSYQTNLTMILAGTTKKR